MILVTGASGFVGRALCRELSRNGVDVRGATRTPLVLSETAWTHGIESAAIGPITGDTDWTSALEGIETVVHLAARTHLLHERAADTLAKYRQINVDATTQLARTAAASGVRRFVFMSSVKVNGERTVDRPFTEESIPQPEDAYGLTKWEAEQALAQVAKETGMECVVLRAPLVYGPGVKGNFLRLMRLIARRTPLPLAAVANRRSLIYLGNLVGAITACLNAPQAAGKTYLISDGEDVCTPDLIRALAVALGVPARLFPFPTAALGVGAAMLRRSAEIDRLTGSLQVDSNKIRNELGWCPPFALAQGLEQTAQWYRTTASAG